MGFYTPTTWTAQKIPLVTVPQCGACGLYQHCQSPKMEPTGQGRRRVLIVAEAPGLNEDKRGIQLCGNAGAELSRILCNLDINLRKDCWLTNAVICRPQDKDGGNRKPSKDELDFCRPSLVRTILDLKPDVIIPMGGPAAYQVTSLAWKEDKDTDVGRWVGWRIPSIQLNAWICPTYHPSFLLHAKDPVAELHVTKHLKAAFELKGKPHKRNPAYSDRVLVTMDHKQAARAIGVFVGQKPIAIDIETTTLKPDSKYAQIICCAVSDGESSVAYPWHGDAIEATRQLIHSDTPMIAANLNFEQRWFRKEFGRGVKNWHHDTVLGAHVLNCGHGICGLKFQAFVLLGVPDYSSHLDAYIAGDDNNSPNRLREVEPSVLLHYCGLDALLECLVTEKQLEQIPC
jgi:uracil-DNA glycosylase family 4